MKLTVYFLENISILIRCQQSQWTLLESFLCIYSNTQMLLQGQRERPGQPGVRHHGLGLQGSGPQVRSFSLSPIGWRGTFPCLVLAGIKRLL